MNDVRIDMRTAPKAVYRTDYQQAHRMKQAKGCVFALIVGAFVRSMIA
jgi:hypothetical protein